MDELSPILIKIETKSRYGNENEIKDADAIFHEYLKYRSQDMVKDLDGETIYSLAERFINFEASDEKHNKDEEYDRTASRIMEDYVAETESVKENYNEAVRNADLDFKKTEEKSNTPMTMWTAAKNVGQRLALMFTAYFGSEVILSHAAKEYVDAAIAITAAVWTGYEAYDANKKSKVMISATEKRDKAKHAAKEEKTVVVRAAKEKRELKLSRAKTWARTSSRYAYDFADLRRARIYKICQKGAEGFPNERPVERDEELRSRFGLWLPPIAEYINMDVDVSEEIKRKAEKLKEETVAVGVCS